MSFSIIKAGKVADVKAQVADATIYGADLAAAATKTFIAAILDLESPDCSVIVEANGHAGSEPGGLVSATVRIVPIP